MRNNFDNAFARVIAHEGGYVDHPKDPGGATNLGITIKTLSGWLGRPATKVEVRVLTRETVKPIYRKQYWDAIKGDDLPSGVDYAAYDYAVNSGPGRAVKDLQRAVGVTPDGVIGLQTLEAVRSASPILTIETLCDLRLSFLKGLKTWATFGKGWAARVADVRRGALEWALAISIPQPPPPTEPVGPAKGEQSDTSVIEVIKKPEAWAPLGGLFAGLAAVASGAGPVQYALAVLIVAGVVYGIYRLVKRERAGS